MIEDRRKHPRHTVLIRCVLHWSGGRREVVCTEVGPANAFLHTRPDGFEVGAEATLEMRAGGLGSPLVKLNCTVARLVPVGGPWPSGVAILWKSAACDLGLDALVRFLTTVLRLHEVTGAEVTLGGHAEFDIARFLSHAADSQAGGAADPRTASRSVSSSRVAAAGGTTLSAAAVGASGQRMAMPPSMQDDTRTPHASPSGQHAAVAAASRPSGAHPSLLPPRPGTGPLEPSPWSRPSGERPALHTDPPLAGTQRISQQALKMVQAVASEAMGAPPPPASQTTSVATAPTPSIEPLRRSSQSRMRIEEISVAAPRPATGSHVSLVLPPVEKTRPSVGERTPALGWKPPTFSPSKSSSNMDPFGFGDLSSPPPAAPPTATRPNPAEGTQQSWPVYALAPGERRSGTDAVGTPRGAPTGPNPVTAPELHPGSGAPKPAQRRHDRSLLVRVDHPIAYERRERVFRGRAVSIGPQAIAVVTHEEQPQLDEWVVVHLPLGTREQPFTIYLCGKLLQVTTETELGPRFVMHIERVEEGRYPGSFQRFLEKLGP
ncbi:MAG: hypothetical protein HY902_18345 [Deltaproteobacteria bacterium]|nr:hypothetical protein [Deltaproteobacteria bacterium]